MSTSFMPRPARMIETTGVIFKWLSAQGWGLISCGGKMYHARIASFRSDCKCGHQHKCEIKVGMRVKFSTEMADRLPNRLPDAKNIEVIS